MAIANWSSPYQFDLTNPYNGTLLFNVQTGAGGDHLYLLDQQNCQFRIGVRSTKSNVPQSDGSILHHRFLTGAEIDLSIQLWSKPDTIACDEVMQDMLDDLNGAFRSLLNAEDNQGRLSWNVAGTINRRMLDDIRLLVYPELTVGGDGLGVVKVTIDSKYPYAEDVTQQPVDISDGGTTTITNNGTATTFPVFQVQGTTASFVLTNLTTDESIIYGGTTITSPDYVELDSFNNTAFLNGDGADLLSSIDIVSSLWPTFQPGPNDITISGADVHILWNPSWG